MVPALAWREMPFLNGGDALGDSLPQSDDIAEDCTCCGMSRKTRLFFRLWLLGEASRTEPEPAASPICLKDPFLEMLPGSWLPMLSSGGLGSPQLEPLPPPPRRLPCGEPCTRGEPGSSPGFGDCPGEWPRRSLEAARTAEPATCCTSACSAAVAPKATSFGFGASVMAAASNRLWLGSTSVKQKLTVSLENWLTVARTPTNWVRTASGSSPDVTEPAASLSR
mmetsp:Transcript_66860/g.139604  ORF Transcript_66860/g.139604 Transcript_66860/m.139604 type:complete len:223 (-) Transcript_66860:1261-1929(-)